MKRFVIWYLLSLAVIVFAQNPQTQTAPIYAVNSKYTNGVAPGYAPTTGSGLNLNIGPGTANCGSGSIVTYAGGTLAMTASATNYIYLNTSSSCAPAVKTSAFIAADIPIAVVVAGSSSITSITDDRTIFTVAPGNSSVVSSFNTRTGTVVLNQADVDAVGILSNATSGNAATATALAAAPSTCGAGVAATGISANGNPVGCFTPSGGGTGQNYNCTGVPSTDLAAINAYLTTPGTNLTVNSQVAACGPFTSSIVLYPNDTLNVAGQTLSFNLADTSTAFPNFGITNNAVLNPVTVSRTCTLAAASDLLTSCSGTAFTSAPFSGAPNGDIEQSMNCTNGLASGVNLQSSIAQVVSGTSVYLADPTGAGITPGAFTCVEQIRDHDIHIIGGNISLTGTGSGGSQLPFELGIGHANRVEVEGGNWTEPDATSSWHQVYWDVNHVNAHDMKFQAHGGSFGQDAIDFEGPVREFATQNIVSDVNDDTIGLKPGEWSTVSSSTFLGTSGNVSGAKILNTQGAGTVGVHIYAPACVNPSGACVSSTVKHITIDGVIGQPIQTLTAGQPAGFNPAVAIQCGIGVASTCGTVSYTDYISIAHILGATPSGSVTASRVSIGYSGYAANQYFSGIDISDVGPDNSTYGADVGAIAIQAPTNTSYSTTVNRLSVHDTAYTGNHGLFGFTGSNGTLSNSFLDNPTAANYEFNGATLTNVITGYNIPYTNQANTYQAYLQDFSLATMKFPTAASCDSSATNMICYDSTNFNWKFFVDATDTIMAPLATGFTSGDCGQPTKTGNTWTIQDAGVPCGASSGNMSDGSGTTSSNYVPLSNGTTHDYTPTAPSAFLIAVGAAPAVACTTVSSLAPANNGCYSLTTSASAAMPAASAFTAFRLNTASGATATFTGVTLSTYAGCSGYISGSTVALTGNQAILFNSDGTNIWATCTAASGTGLSGMTATQVPIAATSSTVTSSKALGGSGAVITTGPSTTVSGDVAGFTGTAGQIQDLGTFASLIPSQYKTWSCVDGPGVGTTAIQSGLPTVATCQNHSGVTWTITGIKCWTDNSGTSYFTLTDGSSSAISSGETSCTPSWATVTLGSTTTIANGGWIQWTFMPDATSKAATVEIYGTY